MSTKKLGESGHKAAAHDIPLLNLLLSHHCALIIATYNPALEEQHPLAIAARSALKAVEVFKSELAKQAAVENQNADWLDLYSKEYEGVWPPKIIGGLQNES